MPDRESSQQRFARALEAAAAYRARGQGQAESLEALLAGHEDLRDLLEPMLSEEDDSVTETVERDAVAAPTPAPSAHHPDRFAHFDLLGVLGSGGMGDVYLARDRRLQRTVALKLIQAAALWSRQWKERLRREARVVARLDHSHICKLYEADEHEGWPYLALQYIEGETLAARIATRRAEALSRGEKTSLGPRTREEIAEAIATVEDVARAVHHAHEQGVIHRDLKPGNIMIATDGRPVVLDFGLARDERSLDASLSSSARPLGTPLYMAPEQIELGNRSRHTDRYTVDRHTDVYALGVILYECLTLERPFEAQTERDLQNRILADDPVPVDRRNRAVPHDLAVVVGKAMEKSPARRYRTALAFAEDLARVRAHEPVLARPVSVFGRVERWTRRNPLVALILLTLTAGLCVSLWQFRRAETNLGRFLQMRDLPIVQDLVREADEELWPAHPDKLAKLAAWLDAVRAIETRLVDHRAALAEVRQSALPASDAMRREGQELVVLRQQLDDKRALLGKAKASARRAAKRQTPSLTDEVVDLESRLLPREATFERQRWRFAASEDLFVHQALADLVRAIEELQDPGRGRLASVVARQREALTLAERSLGDEQGSEAAQRLAADWREAARRVAKDPRFAGFALRPQIGLVPLGMDPVSQLEEFAHLLSGEPAERDAEGKLEIGERTGIVLVLIPGGTFRMGAQKDDPSKPNYDPDAQPIESPVHEVTLDPYLLAKHEMTQGQWLRIADANPSIARCKSPPCPTPLLHPVENVSWEACTEMLRRLGLVLPTEAQWERAARAETDTPWWTGREKSSLANAANISDAFRKAKVSSSWGPFEEDLDDGFSGHAQVGSYRTNPYGLCDVIGNVAEWCGDWELGYDIPPMAGDGRREAPHALYRPIRGGGMGDIAADARSALRHSFSQGVTYCDVGCRPARILTR